ncbi:MAG: LPS-assembly protein LptD, partial [Pseudomonadota bacterium]
MRRCIIAGIALLLWAQIVQAQTAGSLTADRIQLNGTVLSATGNVDIWQNGQHIQASSLKYNRDTGVITLIGPIRVTNSDGTYAVASFATLNQTLQTSILRDARLVFENRLQMAAVQIRQPNARYTELFQVAATSCYVCANQTPIWQIRAKRVLRDKSQQQLYLEHAHLRILGVPVFYLPRMRLPDPNVARATGFLVPRLRVSNLLGTGLELPYFMTLGDHRDLTLTPYASSKTTTLGFRYRQAF